MSEQDNKDKKYSFLDDYDIDLVKQRLRDGEIFKTSDFFKDFDIDRNSVKFLAEPWPGMEGYVAPVRPKPTLQNFKSWSVYIDEWARAYTGERKSDG